MGLEVHWHLQTVGQRQTGMAEGVQQSRAVAWTALACRLDFEESLIRQWHSHRPQTRHQVSEQSIAAREAWRHL